MPCVFQWRDLASSLSVVEAEAQAMVLAGGLGSRSEPGVYIPLTHGTYSRLDPH